MTPLFTFAQTATAPAASLSTPLLVVVFAIIAVALVFDFLNGFHDAANSIATVVSTRVLTPIQAVIWAAFFNFVAAFVFGTKVASTISANLIDIQALGTQQERINVIFAGLLAAIIWNIITWLLALPTSSSHALIGGFGGAAVAKAGLVVIKPWGWGLVGLGIVLSPVFGFILGTINMTVVSWLFRRSTPRRVDGVFRKLQLFSAGIYSLGHGGNDAQKTMGIIVALLMAAGLDGWVNWGNPNLSWIGFTIPMWHLPGLGWRIPSWGIHVHEHTIGWPIILSCHAAIALGTVCGGWRIVKTMGSRITRLQPVGGFCAETAAAVSIIGFTSVGGVPVSTTHAITGAILGVGTTKSVRSVRWIWGQRIVIAWVLTIPCAAFIAGLTYMVIHWTIGRSWGG